MHRKPNCLNQFAHLIRRKSKKLARRSFLIYSSRAVNLHFPVSVANKNPKWLPVNRDSANFSMFGGLINKIESLGRERGKKERTEKFLQHSLEQKLLIPRNSIANKAPADVLHFGKRKRISKITSEVTLHFQVSSQTVLFSAFVLIIY